MKQKLHFSFISVFVLFAAASTSLAQDASMTVPYLTADLVMDGDVADWPLEIEFVKLENTINKVEGWEVQGESFSTNDFTEADLSAKMLTAYDSLYFYVYIEVMDDQKVIDEKAWKADNVEIFFNPDLGNDLPYDGSGSNYTGSDGLTDAIQLRYSRDPEDRVALNWIVEFWGIEKGYNTSNTAYSIETRIPLDSIYTDHTNTGDWVVEGSPLGITHGPGSSLGFEVMVTDHDGNTTVDDQNRDGHLCWANESGNDLAYLNTGLMGTITLGDMPSAARSLYDPGITFYPNPVNDVLSIENLYAYKTAEVFNLLGQKFISTDLNGLATTKLDLSRLPTGVYVLSLTDKYNQMLTAKIIKK